MQILVVDDELGIRRLVSECSLKADTTPARVMAQDGRPTAEPPRAPQPAPCSIEFSASFTASARALSGS